MLVGFCKGLKAGIHRLLNLLAHVQGRRMRRPYLFMQRSPNAETYPSVISGLARTTGDARP